MSVYFFRHGESVLNTQPGKIQGRSNYTPLTERGIMQPKLLGGYLLQNHIIPDEVYASPAVRTRSTAEYTLRTMGLNLPIEIDDDLQELDQGEWVGKPSTIYDDPEIQLRLQLEGKDFKAPGGESMREVGLRKYNWLVDHANPAPDYTTFVFGHGVAIRSLVGHILNWSQTQIYETRTDNTSITRLDSVDEAWHIGVFGAIPHLQNNTALAPM